ncbi:MAG: methyltransferase domain-containing protein [Acidobacteria bacterium]|nr:methyltransferase domain-containing protein [Acidobacteriota bacterium]MBU4307014.1 methyltransferase domain-containing protein [Acidobacteriota bacterium]MBU4404245.1 methyltransferase domain-containing protein [Acidobacteriota bacterium]MCG2812806.1 methyltransferase domain-containing protein [Candidatus Aminicenantes bacterium]
MIRLQSIDSCPLCQSPQISLFIKGTVAPQKISAADFKITDSHYGLRWTFFSCRRCGFVFANPCPAQETIAEFYANLADEEYSQENEGRGRNFSTILKRLLPHALPGSLLLDVGAASGIFLNLARAAGYRVEGIEPSVALVADAERLYGLKLFCGTVEQFSANEKFTVITLLDVLEHVTNPDTFLKVLSGFLAPGAMLVIVTPDIGSLAARIMGGRWWHYRVAHLNFFNSRSLVWLLEKHGFEIVLRKRFAWNFSAYYLLTRLLPFLKIKALQTRLKKLHLKLQLLDSWEIYAKKKEK